MEAVATTAPNVRPHLYQRSPDARGLLWRGEVDLVSERTASMQAEGLHRELLFTDRWQCAVWAGSTITGEHVTLEHFLALPYLSDTLGLSRLPNQPTAG